MKVVYHPIVEKELDKLSSGDRADIGKIVDLFIDYQFQLTYPYLKKIRGDIWELRAKRYRLLLGKTSAGSAVVVLFAKKSQKTPTRYIKLAINRFAEYEN